MSTGIAQLNAIKTLDIRQKVCYSGQMRMILIRICTIIEQSLLVEPRAGLNIEQFSASVPLIIAAGQCNSRGRSSWGSIRSTNHGVCKGKWLVSSKKYCLAASSARRASRRMELGWKCVVRCTPGLTRVHQGFLLRIFSEKVLRISADTEKTYIPHAHILC